MFGLEAQYNWADLSKSYYGPAGTWSVGSKVDAIGFFTGRIGYAANNALFYVKGGAAVANNDQWAAWNGVNFATASNTRWGGTVGVGLEYGFSPNWSFGVEYMHAWLGNNDYAWVDRSWPTDGTTSMPVRISMWSPSGSTTVSVAWVKTPWSRGTEV